MKNQPLILTLLGIIVILIGLIGYLVSTRNQIGDQNDQKVVNCNDSYDCLYEQISKGNPAKVVISEKINSLSLEEKSEVKI